MLKYARWLMKESLKLIQSILFSQTSVNNLSCRLPGCVMNIQPINEFTKFTNCICSLSVGYSSLAMKCHSIKVSDNCENGWQISKQWWQISEQWWQTIGLTDRQLAPLMDNTDICHLKNLWIMDFRGILSIPWKSIMDGWIWIYDFMN